MLPDWPEGTVAVLSTAGPHAIPVSTATRSGDATIHLALAHRRDSLARLREDPRCALTILAAGVAVTAYADARASSTRTTASSTSGSTSSPSRTTTSRRSSSPAA